jgi:transposase
VPGRRAPPASVATSAEFSHRTWRAARERGALVGTQKKRGPAPRVTDSRDKVIADQACELTRWKYRAERAEALVEVQKKVAALLGTPLDGERS